MLSWGRGYVAPALAQSLKSLYFAFLIAQTIKIMGYTGIIITDK